MTTIPANNNTPVGSLIFSNVGQLTPTLKQQYQKEWEELLHMGPVAQQLALNLFRYSYYRNGFAFGPESFIHIASTNLRLAVPEYVNKLRSILDSQDDYSLFIDQFVRNHLDNRQLVPDVGSPSEEVLQGGLLDETGKMRDLLIFAVDPKLASSDRKVIKSTTVTDAGTEYEFMPYIAVKQKGSWYYYKCLGSMGGNVAEYTRIEPLGYRNAFLEYEYGQENVETVIEQNKKDYSPNYGSKVVDADPEEGYEYSTPPPTDDDGAYDVNVLNESMRAQYGVDYEKQPTVPDNSINKYPADPSYKDSKGKTICGAGEIVGIL